MSLKSYVYQERRIKLVFFIFALILLFLAVVKIPNLLVSLLLAIVNYYLLSPIVNLLERKGFSRTIATLIPFGALTFVIITSINIFAPMLIEQATSIKDQLPKYSNALNELMIKIENVVNSVASGMYEGDLKSKFMPEITTWAGSLISKAPEYLSQSLTVIILSPFLAFFILLDGRLFMKNLIALVPNNIFELILNLQFQIGEQMGGFIRAKILQSIIVGSVTFAGLLFLDFPSALVLAIVAGILNIIPYLGPILAFVPAVIVHLANSGSNELLFGMVMVYVVAQVLDTAIITPFVVAKIVDLHPVTVVLVVLVGAQFMGVIGMIICIPLYSAMKVTTIALYRHITDFRS